METQLAHVKLGDISLSSTNKMFRDNSDMDAAALKDIIDSVRQKGVIQPVLLRPNGKAGKYELVCGERRLRASLAVQAQAKDRDTIPAYIRTLTDEEALDLQIVENLQRKDIHPLKEARGYKYLLEKDRKLTTAELCLKFGKSDTYILQRLKLNDLIDDARKDYETGKMMLGHALQICRLAPDDQAQVIKRSRNRGGYNSVQDIEYFINNSVINNLSGAPFKRDDDKLLPRAGACTTCPKRSGASQLFADMKEKDRCFDSVCFKAKLAKFLVQQVKSFVETKPDIEYLIDYIDYRSKPDPEVLSILSANKIKPLNDNDYNTWNSGGRKIKGLFITGDRMGMVTQVYSSKQPTKKVKGATPEKVDLHMAVEGIKERTRRAAELDDEKVYSRVITLLTNETAVDDQDGVQIRAKDIKVPTGVTAAEKAMVRYQIIKLADEVYYKIRDKFDDAPEKEADFFMGLKDDALLLKALREIIRQHDWTGQATHVRNVEGQLIMRVASSWGIPVDRFKKEQAAIRAKREARAKERITALQKEIKPKKKK